MPRSRNTLGSILITRLSALGDVAMTIPVVYSVCKSNPERTFVMVTKKAASKLFVNPPTNLIVKAVDFELYKGVGGLWKLHKELKNEFGVSGYVDLHDVLRTKILRFCFRIDGVTVKKIHKGRDSKRALTRRRNKVMLPLVTTRARYREVFHRIGIPLQDSFEGLYGKSCAPTELFADVIQPKPEGEHWIAIAPFAMHKGKIYPLDLMERVVRELTSRTDLRLFLLGAGKYECETLAEWRQINPQRIVNMAELHKGIPVELALLSHCDVMVSMDSANMHMASLVNLPVVSIWGATHPYCGFMGWRQDKANAVQLDMVCRPCSVFGDKPCFRGDWHCLRGIQPSFIIERVNHILSDK